MALVNVLYNNILVRAIIINILENLMSIFNLNLVKSYKCSNALSNILSLNTTRKKYNRLHRFYCSSHTTGKLL